MTPVKMLRSSARESSLSMLDIIILIVILALLFDISNGWNDSANAIATVVSTRVLTPLQAVIMAASM